MLNKFNLTDIHAFVVIVDQGSFTNASEVMEVSRSHVSKQLNALEEKLGVTLIHRTTRTMRLTDAGRHFYDQAKKSLDGLEQALVGTIDDTQEVRGDIRVNCVGGHIGEDIVTTICSEFMLQYPEVTIFLDFSSHRVDLISEHFDLAFRMGELEDSGFIGRKLMDIKVDTIASQAYLDKYGYPTHPSELAQHHCLTGSVKHWKFEHYSDPEMRYEINVEGRFNCKNGRALVSAALEGNGIIRVPVMYCNEELSSQKLLSVFKDWRVPNVPLYAMYHKDRHQPVRTRTFINFVTEKFEQL